MLFVSIIFGKIWSLCVEGHELSLLNVLMSQPPALLYIAELLVRLWRQNPSGSVDTRVETVKHSIERGLHLLLDGSGLHGWHVHQCAQQGTPL